ncbi:insertion element IS1661 DNA-binding protein [Yersinia pestis biovar Medievalis str. Harbin 35]|uniref:Transposase n=1 Tax=Yersinia pestis TaxID=632 RepID=Q8D1M5_YERPE|nr:putative transposase [Yersinia pestis KIM10+]ADW00825.1 insertion element IS1661 DNA-binding protein [Yersinia pestis biovar Medievalis str. Harbin 35]EEO74472.1 insertion element IS1661 DNA-binding protein [Yersinia pestis Nepal516]EEO79506.1 insertion element IS1661 DNA-binding protein [Yersinia pestis biovar Orientalis str. India 195]EEO91678.1 insertion element IS1661 DNA-binding protein [Yersinia pestis Pestoides A]
MNFSHVGGNKVRSFLASVRSDGGSSQTRCTPGHDPGALNPRSWIFLSMIWRFGSMKHPFSTRLAAVQHYLSGKATLRETARQFSVGKSPLTRWIRAFRRQGEAGLEHHLSRTYTPEFRLCVVRYMMANRCSAADASAHFNIPNETIIQNWMKRYREGGKEALNPSKTGPTMPKDKYEHDSKPFSEMTHAELEKELEYLRAENAYLKKRKALREEKALREQQKKPE